LRVDLLNGFLRLKESKTGSKNVFISQDAATLLSKIPRVEGKPWVFPGTTGKGHYQHTAKVWSDVRKKAGLADVRLHDLRHTFASRSLAEGASLEVVAALLGHRERRTTERYAHLASHPIKEAANRAGRSIGASLGSS
jgi:integrase